MASNNKNDFSVLVHTSDPHSLGDISLFDYLPRTVLGVYFSKILHITVKRTNVKANTVEATHVKTKSLFQLTRYVPNLDCAILRTGGDNIVVEGTPFDVQDSPLVTRDARIISIDTSHLQNVTESSLRQWKG